MQYQVHLQIALSYFTCSSGTLMSYRVFIVLSSHLLWHCSSFIYNYPSHSVQFSSVAQSRPTVCNPMDCSMPGLLVHHQLLEFTKIMSIDSVMPSKPSHPLSSPSPPALSLSQHQGLFKRVNSSHEVAKVLEFQLQR